MTAEEGQDGLPLGVLDVAGRQPVIVRLDVRDGRALVVQDHAGRAGAEDVVALLRATVRAALADDDLIRVVAARTAQRILGDDHGSRPDTGRQRRAGDGHAGATIGRQLDGVDERSRGRAGGDGRDPRSAMVGRIGSGTGVAGRRGHEDAGVVGIEEGQFGGVRVRVSAAADREVDDVDAIADGRLDRCRRVRRHAAGDAADLVHLDMRTRCDARDRPALDAVDLGLDRGVARSRGSRVRPVPVVVPGAVELARLRVDQFVIAIHEPLGADQLVVAFEWFIALDVAAEVAGALAIGRRCRIVVRLVRRIRVRERRMLRPDAGVEHADDDAFAGAFLAAEVGPDGRCSDEAGGGVGLDLEDLVRIDRLDAGQLGNGAKLVGRDDHGHGVQDEVEAAGHLGAVHLGLQLRDERVAPGLEIGAIADRVVGLQVDRLPATDRRVGRREALDATSVGGNRVIGQLDDDGDPAVLAGSLGEIPTEDATDLLRLDGCKLQTRRVDPPRWFCRDDCLDTARQQGGHHQQDSQPGHVTHATTHKAPPSRRASPPGPPDGSAVTIRVRTSCRHALAAMADDSRAVLTRGGADPRPTFVRRPTVGAS